MSNPTNPNPTNPIHDEWMGALNFYITKPEIWNSNFLKSQFEEMAKGGNPENVREDYYPNWKNEDFVSLIFFVETALKSHGTNKK